MSRSVNTVTLIGHLGRDAETKFTQSGISVTRFSVATSRRWQDKQTDEWKEETDWTNVVLWRQEGVASYLTKGKQVYVEGRLHSYSYDDKDGRKIYATEVVANEVILLGGKSEGQSDTNAAQKQNGASARGNGRTPQPVGVGAGEEPNWGVTDDDVPF